MDGSRALSKHHGQSPSTTTQKEVIIQGTAVVDTSIIASPFSPKSKPKKMAQDRKEGELEKPELQAEASDHEKQPEDSPNADYEARWFQKRKKG